jgi:hypothetical protein
MRLPRNSQMHWLLVSRSPWRNWLLQIFSLLLSVHWKTQIKRYYTQMPHCFY